MAFTYQDFDEEKCTWLEYVNSLDTARELEVGRQYKDCEGTTYVIVYVGQGVALGVESHEGVINKSRYSLINADADKTIFYAKGVMAGWKFRDNRPNYRLKNI